MRRPHHAPSPSRVLLLVPLSCSLLLRLWLAVGQAQVTTAITADGTLGTAVTRQDNVYAITGGTRPGNGPNLFHSFERFSVGTGAIASFRGPQTGITHILSRVTGGHRSDIDGTLRSEMPGAHLYLLNPAGVLFGPNARLDVSGSLHVSTAEYLRLADGARFAARLSDTTTLSVAPPAAFGFMGPQPAPLSIAGSILQVPEAQTVSLVGGEVQIVGGQLIAPRGRIQIVSAAAAGEVIPETGGQAPGLQVDSFSRLGRIMLSNAVVDTSGNGGGVVLVRGGNLLVDNTFLFADNLGPQEGAGLGVDLGITAEAVFTNGARVTADSLGAGRARDLRLTAGRVHLEQGAQIASTTLGPGQGGTVQVTATDTLSITGASSQGVLSGLASNAIAGTGRAGTLVVAAPHVEMVGGRIEAGSAAASRGDAGAIQLEVDTLRLTGGAQIISLTEGLGQGGPIRVTASDTISLAGTSPDGRFPTAISAAASGTGAGAGGAGSVVVQASRLLLTGGAQISSSTRGPGQGGPVRITATDTISLAGPSSQGALSGLFSNAIAGAGGAGMLVVVAPLVEMIGSRIQAASATASRGDAGAIQLEVGTLRLTGGAQIVGSTAGAGQGGTIRVTATDTISLAGTSPDGRFQSGIGASTLGTGVEAGNAGSVVVQAPRLLLTGGAQIVSNTRGPGQGGPVRITATDTISLAGTSPDGRFASGIGANAQGTGVGAGKAGAVVVAAETVRLAAGAQIASSTVGPGQGGTVTVTTTDALTITGRDSGLRTTATSSGPGGDIAVDAHRVQLTAGAAISAESIGTGNAGNITITVRDMFLSQHSTVTTQASQADGGNISLIAPRMIRLRDSQVTAAVGGGPATVGGNIHIDPQFVLLQNSQIIANAFEGQGGNIQLTAGVLLADPTSRIDASSQRGINGQVNIQAPVTSISGTVLLLPQTFAPTAALLRHRCAARLREGTVSSLVERGRDGVPASPEGFLPNRLARTLSSTATPSTAGQQRRHPPVAPQGGLQRDATGQLQILDWPTSAPASPGHTVECAAR